MDLAHPASFQRAAIERPSPDYRPGGPTGNAGTLVPPLDYVERVSAGFSPDKAGLRQEAGATAPAAANRPGSARTSPPRSSNACEHAVVRREPVERRSHRRAIDRPRCDRVGREAAGVPGFRGVDTRREPVLGLIGVHEATARQTKVEGDVDARARDRSHHLAVAGRRRRRDRRLERVPGDVDGRPRADPAARIARRELRAPGGKPPHTTTRQPAVATASAAAVATDPSIRDEGQDPRAISTCSTNPRPYGLPSSTRHTGCGSPSADRLPAISASNEASARRSGTNRRHSADASPAGGGDASQGDALTGDKLIVGSPASARIRATSGLVPERRGHGQHERRIGGDLLRHLDRGRRVAAGVELHHLGRRPAVGELALDDHVEREEGRRHQVDVVGDREVLEERDLDVRPAGLGGEQAGMLARITASTARTIGLRVRRVMGGVAASLWRLRPGWRNWQTRGTQNPVSFGS